MAQPPPAPILLAPSAQAPLQLTLHCQGAEARVSFTTFLSRPAVHKERFSKQYRHATLDKKLTRSRVAQEARALLRCMKLGIRVPCPYFVDTDAGVLIMERIHGLTLKQFIWQGAARDELEGVLAAVGVALATIHTNDLIHGDLTTSNLMLEADRRLVLIDFGLSFNSTLPEDKAVDLYVLERAFLSTHPGSDWMVDLILARYASASPKLDAVIRKLQQVRLRGRKKLAFG
jgi:TP53 regulating kinase-like protein